jgi:hypothetical protein
MFNNFAKFREHWAVHNQDFVKFLPFYTTAVNVNKLARALDDSFISIFTTTQYFRI